MKLKTVRLSPKVPVQAVTTLVVAALAYFGVDLDPEVSAAIGVVIGFVAGYFAPAAPTTLVPATDSEAGQGLVELVIAVLVIVILVVVLLRLV